MRAKAVTSSVCLLLTFLWSSLPQGSRHHVCWVYWSYLP